MNLKKTHRFALIILNILIFGICHGNAQQVIFEGTFGDSFDDFARSVKQLNSGKIYVAGYSYTPGVTGLDMALSRLDDAGNPEWTKYYGDSLDDYGFYLAKTSDEYLVICGETYTDSNGVDIIIIKTDTLGNEIWRKTYGGGLNESVKYIEETSDKGFILCGFQNDNFGSNDIYVVKLDSMGLSQWQRTYGGIDNDYADMIREIPGGNFILTADTKSKGAGGYDINVLKLKPNGDVLWDYTYGDSLQNGCQGILVTSGNKYLSYGETEIYYGSPYDFYLELLDSNGLSIWQKNIGGAGADAAFSAIETPDGNFLLTGYSTSQDAVQPNNVVIFKIDTLGNEIWKDYYGGPFIDIGYDIIKSKNGGYLVTGHSNRVDEQFYLLNIRDTSFIENSILGNINNLKINVFPNPTNGICYLNGFEGKVIKVFSTDGRLVYLGEINEQKLNISFLNKGMYVLQIVTDNQLYNAKILIF